MLKLEVGEAFYVILSAAYMHYTLSLALSLREREREKTTVYVPVVLE